MDSRLAYLLVLLPPLPALGEAPSLSLGEALERVRQQGGRDLESLAEALGAEQPLRVALEDRIGCPPDSQREPADLPPVLRALFAAETVSSLPEAEWVTAVWRAHLRFLAGAGRRVGSGLLSRWAAWEESLRAALARRRAGPRDGAGGAAVPAADEPGVEAVVAEWARIRESGRDAPLAAAMEAELALDRARLEFLERASARYSFALDELVAYLLKLGVLERHLRLDPAKGRALLKGVAAL